MKAALHKRLQALERHKVPEGDRRDDIQVRAEEDARRSLHAFVVQAWHILEPQTEFVDGIHVDAICTHLQAIAEGRIKDLIINVPPGHAKSLLTCVFWPAWLWGPFGHPELRLITSSYRADLAIRDSVKCRTLMRDPWYRERWGHVWRMRDDQDTKTRYENDQTGYRVITSVGTGTGERADIVIVDDPTSRDQAESDRQRTVANQWWNGTMWNRVNDPKTGHHVVIQQRLHEDDLTGHLLEKGGYVHLMLPQEYEPERSCATPVWGDPRKTAGQLLWPDKIGPEQVADLKIRLGSYGYSGQYQQRPSPAAGGIFKRWWWRYWRPKTMEHLKPVPVKLLDGTVAHIPVVELPDEFDEMVQSWDTAFRILDTADYVAGGVWASRGAARFLLEQRHGRMEFPAICQAIKTTVTDWRQIRATYIEDAANGSAIISALRNQVPGIIAVKPEGGKVARAHAVSPLVEAGNVYLPHPSIAPWVEGFIEECAQFPNGRHDDQVDQMTQALIKMSSRPPARELPPREPMPVGPYGGTQGGNWML
jgi:predicted phage terminase large subunit-like protein